MQVCCFLTHTRYGRTSTAAFSEFLVSHARGRTERRRGSVPSCRLHFRAKVHVLACSDFRSNFTSFRRMGAGKPALVERLLTGHGFAAIVLSDADTVGTTSAFCFSCFALLWLHVWPLHTAGGLAADARLALGCI